MAVRYQTRKPWGHKVTAEPTTEPVVAANMREQLRIDHTTEDTYLAGLAKAARRNVENWIKRKTATQTVTLTCDCFPAGNWELPFPPIQAVTGIAYRDSAGDSQSLTVPTLHNADEPNIPAVLQEPSTGWPSTDDEPAAVTVTMTAGYGDDAADVPDGILLAIKMLAAHWYNYREAASTNAPETIPMHVESLLTEYKWWNQ